MTPSQAVEKGADFIVIGRPVTQASSPSEVFAKIVDELEKS
jgi:orotidine-5'-phosphate decarboxylase